ncbi:MAG: four-carbon acid sugar kinase family protein [Litorilinea sp.]
MSNIDHKTMLIILADDLTGAADCAARGFSAGLRAEIDLTPAPQSPRAEYTSSASELVALTTDSRHLPPALAAQATRAIVQYQQAHRKSLDQSPIWYKKVDSTLRGNIGAEIDSMLDTINIDNQSTFVVICPAFPQQGRGLHDGKLIRRRASATSPATSARDASTSAASPPAAEPTRDATGNSEPDTTAIQAVSSHTLESGANLVELLRAQSAYPVAQIGLAPVRQGESVLRDAIEQAHADGARLIVVDSMQDDDLATLVAATEPIPNVILCGSAGLVAPLARRIAERKATARLANAPTVDECEAQAHKTAAPARLPHIHTVRAEPIWIVVGSGSRTAHAQIATARQAAIPCWDVTTATPDWDVPTLILHLPQPTQGTSLEGDGARVLAAQLGATVAAGLQTRHPGTLIVVGGDTAQLALEQLALTRLRVLAEVQPGMPLVCNAHAPQARPWIIFKAGNHGEPTALLELIAWIRGTQR